MRRGWATNWRSKAFHDICFQNLADAGFPDRVAFIRRRGGAVPGPRREPRVGIYGGSAGGQNALAGPAVARRLLLGGRGGTAGCHDNRVDKRWWNEAWMGLPGPHLRPRVPTPATPRNLTGDLLLTVGGLDRNVDPAGTLQVVDALIAADKDFELVVFPRRRPRGRGERVRPAAAGRSFFRRALGPR